MLSLAVGSLQNAPDLKLRVSFDKGGSEPLVLLEEELSGPSHFPGWRDFVIELKPLPQRPGRLVIEVEPGAASEVPFYLAEPVIYRGVDRPRRNLIVFLLDTLRADRVSYTGYSRPTTPVLDALAAEGTIFENAYAPSSWTRPSAATLLTGLDPLGHGVNTRRDRIPPALVTLAERLRDAGYATSAFSSNPNVLPYWGFQQGFERFVDVNSSHWTHNDDVSLMVEYALRELERIQRRPFFLYLHVNQMHHPYIPPEPYLAQVGGQMASQSQRYDGEIRFTDDQLGRFWERVQSLGLDDRTLLVVVGDHGEEFLEHGERFHGRTLYEEVLRIPAFLRYPEEVSAQTRVTKRVGLSAIFPLVLALLQIEGATPEALYPLREKNEVNSEDSGTMTFKLDLDRQLLFALRLGQWKYIRTVQPLSREELYDLDADPGEHVNLNVDKPDVRVRLAALLNRRLSAGRPGLHLRLSAGPRESRKLRVTLRTEGRIVSVERDGLEAGDSALLDRERKEIVFEAVVAGQETKVEKKGQLVPRRYPDVDEITVRLEPPESEVRVEVSAGDPPHPFNLVWLGRHKVQQRISFGGESPSLIVRATTIEGRPAGNPTVWIYVVPPPTGVKGKIRKDIEERLRALGYVE